MKTAFIWIPSIARFAPFNYNNFLVDLAVPLANAFITIGSGSTFGNYTRLGRNLSIGANFKGSDNATIFHDCVLLDNVTLGSGSVIDSGTEVRAFSIIGSSVAIGQFCVLNSSCQIGANSSLASHVTIGEQAIVLPNTNLPESTLYANT